PEKIYLFDTDIKVQPDGTIHVSETISLNVRHQQIRRGIYRDIPTSLKENATPLSLTMDGQTHPFFTEHKNGNLRVNFGNDNYIPQGQHTYIFTYTFAGAVDSYTHYNEIYWNVTGNDWNFTIDKARVHLSFPPGTHIQADGISTYTGHKGSKQNQAVQTGELTFETTRPLAPQEGFTVAVPFNKGTVVAQPWWKQNVQVFSGPALFSLLLAACLFVYFIHTWLKVGQDPAYVAVAQYEPLQYIALASMQYLCTQSLDTTVLTCALLDLAMQGYIEITEKKEFFSSTKAVITRYFDKDEQSLPAEEQIMLRHIGGALNLSPSSAEKFNKMRQEIQEHFKQQSKFYVVSNTSYIAKAGLMLAALGIVPFLFMPQPAPFIFINCHFAVFFLAMAVFVPNLWIKTGVGLLLSAFYGIFWVGILLKSPPTAAICQVLFVAGMWGFAFYASLIRNVTPAGRDLFAHIYGFKKYMKTAEVNRVAASNPADAEKIFCRFLPFAFALGLENQWIERFEKILSKAVVEKCTACAGGARFVSKSFPGCVRSSGGGGSHGGGHAGGGHGGGGGGGR
ncbi:MAG: DUF2207 domain-containing protein, partial [Elusimicrobiaceae bacterium]|nr:DUF2207 domain-containing protein [Elusimicrobiaceae bacterium]